MIRVAAALAVCTLAGAAHAVDPLWIDRPPGARRILNLAEISDRARPAVVHVRGTLLEKARGAPTAAGVLSVGSGFFVSRSGYVVTNGPAESPDGHTLYHTDTLAGIIYAFDRARAGSLSNKRVFVRFSPDEGYPDGPIVDAEGCLWTGLFGGWGLRRYSPRGELLQTLRLPCSAVTKAAFAGDDLRTLYITTAHVGLTAEERERQPLAGGLFRVTVDVPGLPQGTISYGI